MAQIPELPITMIASVRPGSVIVSNLYENISSVWDNYPSSFYCILDIIPTPTSQEPNFNINGNDLKVGMWILQPNGNAYMITEISASSDFEATVTLKDIDLYNLVSDYTSTGNNYPVEGINGVSFEVSEDGAPITALIATALAPNLDDSGYWIDDALARFQYRNILKASYTTFYSPNPSYSINSVGEVVYLDSYGVFTLVDTTSSVQVEKAFGVITSLDEPEQGNITVRPFGRIVTTDF